MGYWAKDGSYVYDEDDYKVRRAMNETQGQYYDRVQKAEAERKRYEEEQKRKAAAEEAFRIKAEQQNDLDDRKEAEERQKRFDQARINQKKEENLHRYGTEVDLRHPKDLGERKFRANMWRIQTRWHTVINFINGKSKKFYELEAKLMTAKTEQEREAIVEQMEKLFPTTEHAIRREERIAKRQSGK